MPSSPPRSKLGTAHVGSLEARELLELALAGRPRELSAALEVHERLRRAVAELRSRGVEIRGSISLDVPAGEDQQGLQLKGGSITLQLAAERPVERTAPQSGYGHDREQ